MRKLSLLSVFFIFFVFALTRAQQGPPDPSQLYRFIRISGERAGDVRWFEIWQTRDDRSSSFSWVMIAAEGTPTGVEYMCHRALIQGGGAPLYVVDGEQIPVENAEQLAEQLADRRLVINSESYANSVDCKSETLEPVNGVPSISCEFEGEDASSLFNVKPPATSSGTLWRAADGDYLTRYIFEAQGELENQTSQVFHRYELVQPTSANIIDAPLTTNLSCFNGDVPLPENTRPLFANTLTHAAFETERTVDQVRQFFDEALIPTWESIGNTADGDREYSRVLENGTLCNMSIGYREINNTTNFVIQVYPVLVNPGSLQLTEDLTSPIVIQSASTLDFTVEGGIDAALDEVLPDYAAEGWQQRNDLTIRRDDSAFVTLEKDMSELHVIVDERGERSSVIVQQRDPVCGPTFEVD